MLTYTFENVPQDKNLFKGAHVSGPLNEGYLTIKVLSENGEALSGAKVLIIRQSSNTLMHTLYTDQSGNTELVALPTPAQRMPYEDTGRVYYSNYEITLNAPGYNTTIYRSVSVYPGSTSALTLLMFT